MGYVDFILNLAGLLLWLNWRSIQFDPLTRRTPATLMGTLRPAAPKKLRRWHLLVFIAALIFLRAVFYWQIGPAVNWAGRLNFNVVVLSFRSDWFGRMLVFSIFSFLRALGIFYVVLLLLSLLKGPETIHRFVKIPLGRLDGWPAPVKIILPFAVTLVAWWAATWLFGALQIFPSISPAHRLGQSCVIGLETGLIWKFPLVVLLGLHLLNSYVYFGKHPFWLYVNATAQKIMTPLKKIPLRAGRMDFAPVVGIILICLAAGMFARILDFIYARLPA